MSATNFDPFALARQGEGDPAFHTQGSGSMAALSWPLRGACSAVCGSAAWSRRPCLPRAELRQTNIVPNESVVLICGTPCPSLVREEAADRRGRRPTGIDSVNVGHMGAAKVQHHRFIVSGVEGAWQERVIVISRRRRDQLIYRMPAPALTGRG